MTTPHDALCSTEGCPLFHAAPAIAWCSKCEQPATGEDELCDLHRARPDAPAIPEAITDPWLRREWARKVRTGGAR